VPPSPSRGFDEGFFREPAVFIGRGDDKTELVDGPDATAWDDAATKPQPFMETQLWS
jgi:hypothetical protein